MRFLLTTSCFFLLLSQIHAQKDTVWLVKSVYDTIQFELPRYDVNDSVFYGVLKEYIEEEKSCENYWEGYTTFSIDFVKGGSAYFEEDYVFSIQTSEKEFLFFRKPEGFSIIENDTVYLRNLTNDYLSLMVSTMEKGLIFFVERAVFYEVDGDTNTVYVDDLVSNLGYSHSQVLFDYLENKKIFLPVLESYCVGRKKE